MLGASRMSKESRQTPRCHPSFAEAARIVIAALQAESCLPHCSTVVRNGTSVTRAYTYLSPTISQSFPVLIPPPSTPSSNASPVVNFSSFGSAGSSSRYNFGASSSHTVFMILFASWCDILHFRIMSDSDWRTRSATVETFPRFDLRVSTHSRSAHSSKHTAFEYHLLRRRQCVNR